MLLLFVLPVARDTSGGALTLACCSCKEKNTCFSTQQNQFYFARFRFQNPGLNAKEEWGNSNVPRTRFDQRSNESNLINNWQAIGSVH